MHYNWYLLQESLSMLYLGMINYPPSERYFANCKVYAPLPKDHTSGSRLQRSFMPPSLLTTIEQDDLTKIINSIITWIAPIAKYIPLILEQNQDLFIHLTLVSALYITISRIHISFLLEVHGWPHYNPPKYGICILLRH